MSGPAPGSPVPRGAEDRTETLPAVPGSLPEPGGYPTETLPAIPGSLPEPAGYPTETLPAVPAALPEPGRYRLARDWRPYLDWYRYGETLRAGLARRTADPRLPGRVRRCVLAAIAGTLLGLAVNWAAGLAAALVIAAAGAFYSVRTSAVVPASVRAHAAQRRTGHRLARLARAGYLTLPARAVPGTGSAIEHLVVGPAGVYAVASQHWDRRLPVRAAGAGRIFHGPFDETPRLVHARTLAEQAAARIGEALGQQVTIRPVLAVYGPPLPWPVMEVAGVDVLCGRRLRRYLRGQAAAHRAAGLSTREVERIHALATRLLPPAQ